MTYNNRLWILQLNLLAVKTYGCLEEVQRLTHRANVMNAQDLHPLQCQ